MKPLQKHLVGLAVFACASLPAWSLTVPVPCSSDLRVQCTAYEAGAAYRVATQRGMAVMVELEPGEKVLDNGTGIGGEPGAWQAAMNDRGLMLQPAGPYADTDLLVVTDRRIYVFSLQKAKPKEPVTWLLRFDYPDTRAREREQRRIEETKREEAQQAKEQALAAERAAERVAERAAEEAANPQLDALASAGVRRNESYSMRGDRVLAPTALWDDGQFTFFRYAAGNLPRVFQLLDDGEEALANFHMVGDTIVVHAVVRGFVVRLGSSVLGIRNDDFRPAAFNAGGTGPGEAGAKRVMKRVAEGANP